MSSWSFSNSERPGIGISPVIPGCGNFGGVGSMTEMIGRGLHEPASMAAMDEAVALALAWVLKQPVVPAIIAGPSRSPEHLRLAREALDVSLDAAESEEIGGWSGTSVGG